MDREPGFTEYVAQCRPRLFRTACVLCGDPHRAEDAVQDALARLYVAWPRVNREHNVDGYVRRILVNSLHDQRRRPWRRETVSDAIDRPQPAGMPAEDAQLVWAAIRALPSGQRKVLVLRHLWGLSVQETVNELGISPGTVKSQTSDAIATLRGLLSADFDPPELKEAGR